MMCTQKYGTQCAHRSTVRDVHTEVRYAMCTQKYGTRFAHRSTVRDVHTEVRYVMCVQKSVEKPIQRLSLKIYGNITLKLNKTATV